MAGIMKATYKNTGGLTPRPVPQGSLWTSWNPGGRLTPTGAHPQFPGLVDRPPGPGLTADQIAPTTPTTSPSSLADMSLVDVFRPWVEALSGTQTPPTGTQTPPAAPVGVVAPNLPNIDATQGLNEIYDDALAYAADPTNIPQYYTGPTVAGFDQLQEASQQALLGDATQYDDLTQDLVSEYQAQLDPNSEVNRLIGQRAAQSAAGAFYGAGTPGSARSQYTANLASQDAVRANRENALRNISGLRSTLTGGADILGEVGQDRQDLTQNIINEDIKRFNYAQLSPQQQLDRILGLAAQQDALRRGQATGSGSSGLGIFGNILGAAIGGGGGGGLGGILSSIFRNEGGPVYANEGGIMSPEMQMDALGPDMMGSAAPEMQSAMPMGADIAQITAVSGPEVSELDKAEGIMQGLAAASGGTLKVTRKEKGKKK